MLTETAMRPPHPDEYFEYYRGYIQLVPAGGLWDLLAQQVDEVPALFAGVSDSAASVPHPPYTWTLKQVVGHLIDAERIFANRLHRFAAGDFQALPGMEQDPYIAHQDFESPPLIDLIDELVHCRQANLLLIRRTKPQAWDYRGVASGHPITVRALAYILAGHIRHHLQIVRKRLGRE